MAKKNKKKEKEGMENITIVGDFVYIYPPIYYGNELTECYIPELKEIK